MQAVSPLCLCAVAPLSLSVMKTKSSLFSLWSFIFCLSLCPSPSALSQIPQGFNYQAVVRDGSGNLLQNAPLQVRFFIRSESTGGTLFYQEFHPSVITDNSGMINLVIGKGTEEYSSLDQVDWSVGSKFLSTEITYNSTVIPMGSAQLFAVPYAMTAKSLTGATKLGISGTTENLDEALFEVKNKYGQTIFAVYNEGVRIYVDDGAKGLKGGFAVGGFDMTKATKREYFIVSDDSVRIYLDSNPLTKGKKSGFAVGGYDMTKGDIQNYLDVSGDSVRIYIDSNPDTKKLKGGFAVGGYDMTKGITGDYFNVSGKSEAETINGEPRVVWYPAKEAFRAGNVLIESEDSVGTNSWASGYKSKAIGDWSQALGFQAIARGDYSTAIGKNAVANDINSFAFGDGAKASDSDSYSFGAGAIANAAGSYAFGSAGRDDFGNLTGYMTTASGDYSIAIGQGARASNYSSFALGSNVLAGGASSMAMGVFSTTSGSNSTAIGIQSAANGPNSIAIGMGTIASGSNSMALGSGTTAQSCYETVIGSNNLIYTPISTTWNGSDRIFVIGNGYWTLNHSTGQMESHPSNALTVLKNGKIGIGTESPSFRLDIQSGSLGYTINSNVLWQRLAGSSSNQDQLKILHRRFIAGTDWTSSEIRIQKTVDATDMGYIAFKSHYLEFGGGYGGNPYMTLVNGKLGIGTSDPQYELHLMGYAWCSGTWATSDVRWKKNIIDLNNTLSDVCRLRSVRFNYRTDEFPEMKFDTADQIGLVAQEVEQVFPSLVKTDKNGYKAVAYDKLGVFLVEAIKEQQDIIESQQQQIDELKAMVEKLVQK